jgi:hypothetical protein
MGVLAKDCDHLPPQNDEWTKEGSLIHDAIQRNDSSILETDEQRNTYSKLTHRLNKFLVHWGAQPGEEVRYEERLWMHDETGVFPLFTGQADYTRIRASGEEALIIDFKTGWDKPPIPESNHQLKSLAALRRMANPGIKKFTLQIISPHYDFQAYEMDEAMLDRYEQALRGLLNQLKKEQVPVPGRYCKHCLGFLICPAVRKNMALIKLTKEADFPMTLPTGAKGARILEELKVLEAFTRKCYEHYKIVLFNEPDAIPGWSLVPGDKVRTFKPAKKIWEKMQKLLGDKLLDAVSISVTKAENFLPEGEKIPEDLITIRQNNASLEKVKKPEITS